MNITCNICGSQYELESEKVPWRDKDSVNCQVCGNEIHSWNESYTWSAKLIKLVEKHKNFKTK